ncbi:MAG: hypothetical protein JKY96_06415, partial [Phycisphaerales bacterium]|nr:hypothetical protein [Phycisphaerales bacterium]
MPDALPLGEEIWVRRDTRSRGGPFMFRETRTWLCLAAGIAAIFFVATTFYEVLQNASLSPALMLGVVGILLITIVPFTWMLSKILVAGLKISRYCPVWLYAEQINPECLTIFHFRKPPTVIQLKDAKIERVKNPIFKLLTTIHVEDETGDTSATLAALTPEEYNRVMKYWQAANNIEP